jgi:hypothetical protein
VLPPCTTHTHTGSNAPETTWAVHVTVRASPCWMEAEAPLTRYPSAGGGRNGGRRTLRRGRVLSVSRARIRHLGVYACVAAVHCPTAQPRDAQSLVCDPLVRLIRAVRAVFCSGTHPGKVERLPRQSQGERVPQLTLHVPSARRPVRANGRGPRHRRVSDAYSVFSPDGSDARLLDLMTRHVAKLEPPFALQAGAGQHPARASDSNGSDERTSRVWFCRARSLQRWHD